MIRPPVLAIAASLALCWVAGAIPVAADRPDDARPAPASHPEPGRREYAVASFDPDGHAGPLRTQNIILDVHDGDTATFLVECSRIDIHTATFASFAVRIEGLFAEELGNPGGEDARAALSQILMAAPPTSILVEPTGRMSFGRAVCKVSVVDEHGQRRDVADLMTAKGFNGHGIGASK